MVADLNGRGYNHTHKITVIIKLELNESYIKIK